MDYSQRYRELHESGHGRDVALGVLRREGATFILCIKAVVDIDRVSISEAKSIVHRSPAWSDEREARENFWDEVIRLLESESSAEPDAAPDRRGTVGF
jgi:hypothetical protein